MGLMMSRRNRTDRLKKAKKNAENKIKAKAVEEGTYQEHKRKEAKKKRGK